MRLLGMIPEPPFDPRSWSGSSAFFFGAMKRAGVLDYAVHVQMSPPEDAWHRLRKLSWPLERWRAAYHASVPRFRALSRIARQEVASRPDADGILQIGCWFSAAGVRNLPCYSYHDGNAALWYRHYGRGLLGDRARDRHLDWERRTYSQMSGIFVMSSWLGQSFVSDFGMPASKIHVVGAGINFSGLPAVPERDFSRARFLMVGRDFQRKGGHYLLEAFRKVRAAVPEAELAIVGPDPIPAGPGVTFPGFLSKSSPQHLATLASLFARSTTMVLPSIYEPFGISLAEGMAYGLPCVTVDRCAMPEIVQHGITGLVAQPEDADSLAEAMITLARAPDTAAAMGRAGRRRVEQNYTWDAVAGKIGQVIARG